VFDERSPIYRQIAEQIKTDILKGTLTVDSQVMSTNQYAAFYRINPATAAKAFQQLVDEGVLYKRRGLGMFVSPDALERLQQEHRGRFFDEMLQSLVTEARTIGIPLRDVIERLEELAKEDQS
jgi:GntR family transcriptional regulator